MNTYSSWTIGGVVARDTSGLSGVAIRLVDIRCEVSDGVNTHTAGPWSYDLEDPDPNNFEALISSEDDATAALAQRLSWISSDFMDEMKASADTQLANSVSQISENERVVP